MTSSNAPAMLHRVDSASLSRGRGIALAAVAIVVGIIGLALPDLALRFIGLIFGIYLIVAGIFRMFGTGAASTTKGRRGLEIFLGALVVVAGILCLNNPFGSATVLGIIIGIGWILDGLGAIIIAMLEPDGRGRLLAIGGVSIAMGVGFIVIPHAALSVFVFLASVMVLIIGATILVVMLTWRPADSRPAVR